MYKPDSAGQLFVVHEDLTLDGGRGLEHAATGVVYAPFPAVHARCQMVYVTFKFADQIRTNFRQLYRNLNISVFSEWTANP